MQVRKKVKVYVWMRKGGSVRVEGKIVKRSKYIRLRNGKTYTFYPRTFARKDGVFFTAEPVTIKVTRPRTVYITYKRLPLKEDACPVAVRPLFDAINVARFNAGAPRVIYNAELGKAAQRHAQDMADNNYFSHISLSGKTMKQRVNGTKYTGQAASEIIASGFPTPNDYIVGWMNSEGHRKAMLDVGVHHVGVGFAERDGIGYAVANFGWDMAYDYQ
jgi:uncharacterized protein YkwD